MPEACHAARTVALPGIHPGTSSRGRPAQLPSLESTQGLQAGVDPGILWIWNKNASFALALQIECVRGMPRCPRSCPPGNPPRDFKQGSAQGYCGFGIKTRGRRLLLSRLKIMYITRTGGHFLRHRRKYADLCCEACSAGGRTGRLTAGGLRRSARHKNQTQCPGGCRP